MASPASTVFEFLKDGATTDMGTTAGTYSYTVPAGKDFYLQRVNVTMIDGTVTILKFGGENALTNGCLFQVRDAGGTVLQHFGTDDVPIKRNIDFAALAGPDVPVEPAAGDDAFIVRWTVAKAGEPVRISAGDSFNFISQDSLAGITEMNIMVQGILKEI